MFPERGSIGPLIAFVILPILDGHNRDCYAILRSFTSSLLLEAFAVSSVLCSWTSDRNWRFNTTSWALSMNHVRASVILGSTQSSSTVSENLLSWTPKQSLLIHVHAVFSNRIGSDGICYTFLTVSSLSDKKS